MTWVETVCVCVTFSISPQSLPAHDRQKCNVSPLSLTPSSELQRHGIVQIRDGRIESWTEQRPPHPHNLSLIQVVLVPDSDML